MSNTGPTRDGSDKAQIAKESSRLQEKSRDRRGNHLAKEAGESFTWDPADKFRPNPQRGKQG